MRAHNLEKQRTGNKVSSGTGEGGEQNSPPGGGAFLSTFIPLQNLCMS